MMNSDQDLGPRQERQPTMSDGMTADRPIKETGLRILAKGGAEIDYRSERDLISKIWESSIDTDATARLRCGGVAEHRRRGTEQSPGGLDRWAKRS